MIKIILDGQETLVERGITLLETARKAGIYIPTLCYLPGISPPTHPCGICVVEVEGEGIVRSCEYKIEKEISVNTQSKMVKEIRKKILENLIANHYGDCKAPCHTPCPGGLNIQGYIGFIAKGDFKAALALIKEKLPLPASVGRVCPRFCEPVCRRTLVDQAVAINNLKRFVADYCYEHGELPVELPALNGKKVAVIGAGPAGLSCAYFLRLKGYEVAIFDKEEEPGGLLRYGIPTFKLPREVLKKEIESIFKEGITFYGGKAWGRDFTLKDLKKEGFHAVFLAIGARKEKYFGFSGEELAESGLGFLINFNKGKIDISLCKNKRCAILGCSYTAVELSRVLRRLGAE
ncbi:MAG: FAD-dependent oxidoreductase, partial [Caldimicrobium sp.]